MTIINFNGEKEYTLYFKTTEHMRIRKVTEDMRLNLEDSYGTAWVLARTKKEAKKKLTNSIDFIEEWFDYGV